MDWNSPLGILRRGMSLERDGYQFYMQAAARASDERGRRMFEDLARQEVDHLRLLLAEYRSVEAGTGWIPYREAMKADFPWAPKTPTYPAKSRRIRPPCSPLTVPSRWRGTSRRWSSGWRPSASPANSTPMPRRLRSPQRPVRPISF